MQGFLSQQNCWAVSSLFWMGLCLGQPNSDIKTALDLGSAVNYLFRSSFRTVVNNAFSEN
jgi:hypothetical protein